MSRRDRLQPSVRPLFRVGVDTVEGRREEEEKVLCERCGGEMYRMHAVWRCPSCGFKTDCCGW